MKKLSINREYLVRHAFVALLMLGMGGWFGYDGLVAYPRTDAAALYESIESEAVPEGMTVDALAKFKDQKIKTQLGLMICSFVASFLIALGIFKALKFRFEWDETGFTVDGERFAFSDIKAVDRTLWKKKGIIALDMGARRIKLDSWHHCGVGDVVAILPETEQKAV